MEISKSTKELQELGNKIITLLKESGGNYVDNYIICRAVFDGLKVEIKSKGIIIVEDGVVE